MTEMQLPFDIGQKVHIDGHKEITALVLSYEISYNGVSIRLGWMADGRSHNEWFPVWRISAWKE